MQLVSVEELVHAIRASELFTPEQFVDLMRELAPLRGNPGAMMRRLVRSNRVTLYQLKKVLHGKAAELFIGPYVVMDKLGEGGMGKVYRARHAAEPGCFALKVVRSALVSNPVVRGRYAREVQTASTLDHPNIVRLFDAGEAAGKFYLAMEFVDGVDLARLMHQAGSVEVAEACEYIRQTALGLQHAHENGFVHRDVKPSNIVVAGERHIPQATEPAVVKILDLGLARAIDPDDMVVPNLTRDHTVVGTPDYMAPEQAKNSKRADARCDLYSLGCTFYAMLTGRVPFPKEGAIEKIIAHQSELSPPVQALRPEVPAKVAELVARLMAKNPDDRIQTAAEVAAALESHTRYPHGAPPVVVQVREPAVAAATKRPGSTTGQGGLPWSGASSLAAFSPLSLSQEEIGPKFPPVAPSERTPRPRGTAKRTPATGKTKAKTRAHREPAQPTAKPTTTTVPQFVWVAVALAGVAVLGLMLWLVANP